MDTQRQTKKLYIFDMDGTLITSYMSNPDKDFDKWEPLPGRREKLAGLLAEGHTIAVASNQGGVAFGLVSEDAVRAKFEAVRVALGLPDPMHMAVAFGHPNGQPPYNNLDFVSWRKPSPRMIFTLMLATGHERDSTIYIGDRAEDRQAAMYAGVEFIETGRFFGSPEPDDDLPF